MPFDSMTTLNAYVVRPDWDSIKSDLFLGEESFDQAENMPVHLYPCKAEIVSVPEGMKGSSGDTIYFTWNGISFNRCISREENLFILNKAWYAYKHDGQLQTLEDFVLLQPVPTSANEGGLITSGYTVVGNLENAHLEEVESNMPLNGIVAVLPGNEVNLKIGDAVYIITSSDVKVEIDGKSYYRTRLSEILFKYEGE